MDKLVIKYIIKDFYTLLDKYPDRVENFTHYKAFISQMMRINKDKSIPTLEIMTVIKSKRPIIYSQLKQQKNNLLLQLLTSLEMDEVAAEKILTELSEASDK